MSPAWQCGASKIAAPYDGSVGKANQSRPLHPAQSDFINITEKTGFGIFRNRFLVVIYLEIVTVTSLAGIVNDAFLELKYDIFFIVSLVFPSTPS